MNSENASLARALDEEFKRLAKLEDRPMGELIEEVAGLVGCTGRQLYNYRSGKWPIPTSLLPAFCNRFHSRLLLDTISSAIQFPLSNSTVLTVEDGWAISKQVINRTVDHAGFAQKVLGGAEFTRAELIQFSELTDSIIRDCQRLYSFAERAYEARRDEAKRTA